MNRKRKLILLGIDGFDPKIVEELFEKKRLPNFKKIQECGSFSRLATSNPAQSPVAWSSLAIGANPGQHGLFDFIRRNPKTYLPELAILERQPALVGTRFVHPRKGVPFWQLTSRHGIPTHVIKWPVTFPPEKIFGNMLGGLGIPDINHTLGRYTFFTSERLSPSNDRKGDYFFLGSNKSLIKIDFPLSDKRVASFQFRLCPEAKKIIFENSSGSYEFQKGVWSDWIDLSFHAPLKKNVFGMAKFYLASLYPEIRLYMTPVHIHPEKPVLPISQPNSYSADLCRVIGKFHTLGLPEETNGLVDDCFTKETFLQLVDDIQSEREKMFDYELQKFHEGLLVFVFDTIDRVQHILWQARDRSHPKHDETLAKDYEEQLFGWYERMDKIVGKILAQYGDDTRIMIVSDHGFSSFRRSLHVNSWLRKKEWLVFDAPAFDQPLFQNVCWEKTIAYAVGFSSIYLNLAGRERKGIVKPEEKEKFLQMIRSGLLEWRDGETGKKVITEVYEGKKIYHGGYAHLGPDLVLGVNEGYRVSWQTAVGESPKTFVEDNLKEWSGDHLIDPGFVPGIFFSNHMTNSFKPHVYDIAPSILSYFGIAVPQNMEGKSLW